MAQGQWDPLKELTTVQARMNKLFVHHWASGDTCENRLIAWSYRFSARARRPPA